MDIYLTLSSVFLVVLLIVGVEIVTILGVGAILFTLNTAQFPMTNVSLTMFDALNLFPLIALPLFILTGDLVAEGGIAAQIMKFARAAIGWARGGSVLTAILASGFFAAISGSNAATTATIGRIVIPDMVKDKYPPAFAAATVAAGGTVGIIIPPSIMFILYGVTVGVSVGDLFLGGILPGLIMVLAMALAGYVACRMYGYDEFVPFSMPKLVSAFLETKYALGAIVIMLGGIYLGIFTPTESGAVACAYCLVIGKFVTRKIKIRDLPAIMSRSGRISGLVAPVIALAVVFSQNLAVVRVPELLVSAFVSVSSNPTIIILMLFLLLLIVGCVMETAPNVLLLAPILAPFAVSLGFHPVHFGVWMTCVLAIGFVTPPVGLNLFVAAAMSNSSVLDVAKAVAPFLIALMIAVILIAFIPQLTLAFIETEAGIRLW